MLTDYSWISFSADVFIDDAPEAVAFAGDQVNITLSGVDMVNVNIGKN